MADKPAAPGGSGRSTKQDVLFYLAVLGVLFFLWVKNGGYKDQSATQKYVDSPVAENVREGEGGSQPQSSGTATLPVTSEEPDGGNSKVTDNSANSPWYGKVKLSPGNASSETNPDKEYI